MLQIYQSIFWIVCTGLIACGFSHLQVLKVVETRNGATGSETSTHAHAAVVAVASGVPHHAPSETGARKPYK